MCTARPWCAPETALEEDSQRQRDRYAVRVGLSAALEPAEALSHGYYERDFETRLGTIRLLAFEVKAHLSGLELRTKMSVFAKNTSHLRSLSCLVHCRFRSISPRNSPEPSRKYLIISGFGLRSKLAAKASISCT